MGKTWSRGTNSRFPFGVNVNLSLPSLIETEPLVRDLRSCEQNHLGMADMGGEKELDQFGGLKDVANLTGSN